MRPQPASKRSVSIFGVVAMVLLLGCSKADQSVAPAPPAGAATLPAAPPPDALPPPPSDAAATWTPTALDELLAPIALYPDVILAQVLAASTNAQEVLDAGNWLLDHESLTGDALTTAAAEADFSPSVQALVHFPTVVDMMCRELDWTRQVGDAFSADQPAVLSAVQRLRAQAADVGNLQSTPQMAVEKTVENEKQVIVIQPANPQVVYVPQYNPTQVYSAPPAQTTTTTTTTSTGTVATSDAVVGGLLAFGVGVLVGSLLNDNDHHNYYCYPNWGYGGVYYGPRPYYPHSTFVYAPRYPGYRPAPYYRPPAAYPYQYNRYGNTNVNINVNNNYFNRFEGNRNRVTTYQPRSPVAQPRTATRPVQSTQTYAGANRPAPRAATRDGARQPAPTGTYQGARPAQNVPSSSPTAAQRSQPAARPQPVTRPSAVPGGYQRPSAGADRGYPQVSGRRSDVAPPQNRGARSFNGAGAQQGAVDRAASERGRASMHSAQRPSQRPAQQPLQRQSQGNRSGGRRS
jgi:Protein of unknown function (DUF3300)